jgi:hypothetical protein
LMQLCIITWAWTHLKQTIDDTWMNSWH